MSKKVVTTAKNVAIIIVAISILVGAFAVFTKLAADDQPVAAKSHKYDLVIADGQLVEGPDQVTVNEGDTITLHLTSDADGEFHLHGYDKEVILTANQPASLTFKADISGSFHAELHEPETEILDLTVMPR